MAENEIQIFMNTDKIGKNKRILFSNKDYN